jgi:hypothetical protein
MRDGLSLRIVNFIGGLYPLYEPAHGSGHLDAARCLADGTMIFAIEEDEESEHGFVRIHWQGDPERFCEILGEQVATVAVARYVELHRIAVDKRSQPHYQHMAQHFEYKTGGSLMLDSDDGGAEAYALLGRLLEKGGTAVAIAVLKKAIGF